MAKQGLRIIVTALLLISIGTAALAQPAPAPAAPVAPLPGEEKPKSGGPRKQLATIIFAGLGGAILGLSTLSFYGRPQEKLQNIAIGFAFGVIAGTVIVTYKAASNPQELYGLDRPLIEGEMLVSRELPAPAERTLNLGLTF